MTHIEQQYKKFKDKHGYIPKYFDVYNAIEVNGECVSTLARGGSFDAIGVILILEVAE